MKTAVSIFQIKHALEHFGFESIYPPHAVVFGSLQTGLIIEIPYKILDEGYTVPPEVVKEVLKKAGLREECLPMYLPFQRDRSSP